MVVAGGVGRWGSLIRDHPGQSWGGAAVEVVPLIHLSHGSITGSEPHSALD